MFSKLFSSTVCGPTLLKNRLVMAPVVTGMERVANISALRDFYAARAKGGVSMITVSHAIVDSFGKKFSYERCFDEELDVMRHRIITKALHQENTKAILQLCHFGIHADVPVAFSACGGYSKKTGHLSVKVPGFLLSRIVKRYTKIAYLAMQSDYDGIEIDASGRSLIGEFLSATTNTRKDNWGKNQISRFKLAIEIVRNIRKNIGSDKLIGFRFNLLDFQKNGADWAEIKRLLQMLQLAGVNYFCASFGIDQQIIPTDGDEFIPGVWYSDFETIASESNLTVVFSGEPENWEQAESLAQKYPNAIFELTEPLIADPLYVKKLQDGCLETISPCYHCYACCQKRDRRAFSPIFCLSNPFLFSAQENEIKPARRPKKILVIGAGLAGSVFSLYAQKRGHTVTLIEKTDKIGGQLNMMGKIPGKTPIKKWIAKLSQDLVESGVNIQFNTLFKQRYFDKNLYDEIVIAAGSAPVIPNIAGIDSSNIRTYEELLQDNQGVGKSVALLGVNQVSVDIARYLLTSAQQDVASWRKMWGIGDIRSHRGGILGVIPAVEAPERKVFILEYAPNSAEKYVSLPGNRITWRWLLMHGMQTFINVNCESIDTYSIRISYGDKHKDRIALKVNHIVLCAGQRPNITLSDYLSYQGVRHHKLGACSLKNGYLDIKTIFLQSLELAKNI